MSDFLKLFPQDQLGRDLIDFSLQVNEFAKAPPSLSLQERNRVNEIFEPLLQHEITRNIARMADEAVASHLQAAGSAVYAIGHALARGERSPLVPATLARTVLENCAIVIFLCDVEDHVRRTGRAINVFHLGLLGAEAGAPEHRLNPLFQASKKLKQKIGSVGVMKEDNLTQNYNQLVANHLEAIDAGSLYKVLNRFTHHNMVSHIGVMASADQQTLHNYADVYDFSSRAGAALICAVDAAASFKSAHRPKLSGAREKILYNYGNFYTYCTKGQAPPEASAGR